LKQTFECDIIITLKEGRRKMTEPCKGWSYKILENEMVFAYNEPSDDTSAAAKRTADAAASRIPSAPLQADFLDKTQETQNKSFTISIPSYWRCCISL
jgi:hypothetical protein